MISYENWLEQRRTNPQDREVLRVSGLKKILEAESKAAHLRQWLADRVTLHIIETVEDALQAAQILAGCDMLALDIETAKTDP